MYIIHTFWHQIIVLTDCAQYVYKKFIMHLMKLLLKFACSEHTFFPSSAYRYFVCCILNILLTGGIKVHKFYPTVVFCGKIAPFNKILPCIIIKWISLPYNPFNFIEHICLLVSIWSIFRHHCCVLLWHRDYQV